MGEPLGCALLALRLLQFLPGSQVASCDTCDGSRDCGSRVEHSRVIGLKCRQGKLERLKHALAERPYSD